MLRCFVDESDRGDFHRFSGLIADEHATQALTHELNQLMLQVSVDFGISDGMPQVRELPSMAGLVNLVRLAIGSMKGLEPLAPAWRRQR